jgi:hypothetical protein
MTSLAQLLVVVLLVIRLVESDETVDRQLAQVHHLVGYRSKHSSVDSFYYPGVGHKQQSIF